MLKAKMHGAKMQTQWHIKGLINFTLGRVTYSMAGNKDCGNHELNLADAYVSECL